LERGRGKKTLPPLKGRKKKNTTRDKVGDAVAVYGFMKETKDHKGGGWSKKKGSKDGRVKESKKRKKKGGERDVKREFTVTRLLGG